MGVSSPCYLVPTTPTAWHGVSLNCSGSHKEPFLLSALFCFVSFLYLRTSGLFIPGEVMLDHPQTQHLQA